MSSTANLYSLPDAIRARSGGVRTLLWCVLVFILPSLSVMWRFTGSYGLLLYLILTPLLLLSGRRWGRRFLTPVPDWAMWLFAATLFLALLVLFALIYPLADAGIVGGGSDRDDALNVAVRELVQGRYPYYPRTYLDRPITPLPGSLLLSLPFVALGNSAYQNFFWLALFFLLAARRAGDPRPALLLLLDAIVLAPAVTQQLLTGGDLPTNSISLLVVIHLLCQPRQPLPQQLALAALFGVTLSSRAGFWFLLPPLVVYLSSRQGWRQTLLLLGVSGAVFLLVTLPFYLYDPAGFSPLHTVNRLARFGIAPPFTWLLPLAAGLMAILLGLRASAGEPSLYRRVTIALAAPILLALAAGLVQPGTVDFAFVDYGVMYLFFGAWALLPARLDHIPQTSP